MIEAFGSEIDDGTLRTLLRREQAEDAYELLRAAAGSEKPLDEAEMERLWHSRFQ